MNHEWTDPAGYFVASDIGLVYRPNDGTPEILVLPAHSPVNAEILRLAERVRELEATSLRDLLTCAAALDLGINPLPAFAPKRGHQ